VNSVAQDIVNLLVTLEEGYKGGTTDTEATGWAIFDQLQPSTPKQLIVVREYEGPPPVVFLNDTGAELPLENLRFQIAVRATTNNAAKLKAQKIAKLLTNYDPFVVESTDDEDAGQQVRYGHIVRITSPLPLATEEQGVYIWVVSFKSARQEETVPY
jgi:hypothetical protein